MNSLQVFQRPKLNMRSLPWCDDTNTPYVTNRRAFRRCGAGVLRLHAAETLFRPGREEWHALVLRPSEGQERVWFYREGEVCRRVYSEWAGHGDPEGFDFSWEAYSLPQNA